METVTSGDKYIKSVIESQLLKEVTGTSFGLPQQAVSYDLRIDKVFLHV